MPIPIPEDNWSLFHTDRMTAVALLPASQYKEEINLGNEIVYSTGGKNRPVYVHRITYVRARDLTPEDVGKTGLLAPYAMADELNRQAPEVTADEVVFFVEFERGHK